MASSSILLLPLAFALIFADSGYYVPRGFYTINRFGQASPLVSLAGGLRVPRSVYTSASASSSSSSNGPGQSQTFTVSGNGPIFDPFGINPAVAQLPLYPNEYNASPVLVSRFGGDGEVAGIGVSGTSSGGTGVYSSSSTNVGPDGKVHYSTHTGKF